MRSVISKFSLICLLALAAPSAADDWVFSGDVGFESRYFSNDSQWQDQSGNDRYSTEVVLQGCGSTLTMLDGGSGGGAPGGYDSGQSSPEPAAESSRMLSDKRAKASSFIRGQLLQVTKDRHSVRAALRLSLKVLRFESDLCELNRL